MTHRAGEQLLFKSLEETHELRAKIAKASKVQPPRTNLTDAAYS